MWNKCSEKLPNNDGLYLTAESGFTNNYIYRLARYKNNLGNAIGLEDYDGESGFYDSDPEWGSFVIKPEAWQPIEKYIGDDDGKIS